MSSERRFGGFAKWMALAEESRAWSAANPKMAADWDAAIEEDDARRLALEHQATAPGYLRKCGVGQLEAAAIGRGLRDTMARMAVQRWLTGGRLVLLLSGGAGCGKSVAAAEALALARPAPGRFMTSDVLARLSYFDLETHESLCRLQWLVIDDLGVEFSCSTSTASLDGLLCERIRQARHTILTTNLSPEAFASRYAPAGSRLASRFSAYGAIHGCGELDLRRGAA